MYRQRPHVHHRPFELTTGLFFALIACLPATTAQLSNIPASTTATTSTTFSSLNSRAPTSTSSTRTFQSSWVTQTTSYSLLSNLPTISVPSPTTTIDPEIPAAPPTNGWSNYENPDYDSRESDLVNLYFLFFLLGAIAIGLVGWWYYRRRRKNILAARSGRQHALERDLQNSSGGDWRAFFSSRGNFGRRRWFSSLAPGGYGRDDEGLNERGEAPPPYKKRVSVELASVDPAVIRGEEATKPPDYDDCRDTTSSAGRSSGTISIGHDTVHTRDSAGGHIHSGPH